MAEPSLSVVLCTRDRPDHLPACVGSILANPGDRFELVIIDQSNDLNAYQGLQPLLADPRVRYFPEQSRGVSRARNAGIRLARAELIAFTDDDCRAPPDWVSRIERYFAARPQLALAFGKVTVPQGTFEAGYAAAFQPAEELIQHRFPSPLIQWGLSANMAARRGLFERIGQLDPLLGAGSHFQAGEELDLEMRALGAGLLVAHTPAFEVEHLGVRVWKDVRALWVGYMVGTGAAYGKNLRLGTSGIAALWARFLLMTSWKVLGNLATGRRPIGAGLLLPMLTAAAEAFRAPLDRPAGCFREPPAQPP